VAQHNVACRASGTRPVVPYLPKIIIIRLKSELTVVKSHGNQGI
jgi:hypothetical protein